MSQKASGYERMDGDAYFTPAWVTEALASVESVPHQGLVYDPGAGEGHILEVFRGLGHNVRGMDIVKADGAPWYIEQSDFLGEDVTGSADFIVTNPPYGKGGRTAVRFIERALEFTKPRRGKVAMLLRVDFDSAATRAGIFGNHPAFDAKYALTKRIRWANLETEGQRPHREPCVVRVELGAPSRRSPVLRIPSPQARSVCVMTEEKLSQSELHNLFGDTIPIEAVNLIWNAPGHTTIGELRKQLRSMGRDHRRLSVTADAIRDGLSEYLVDRPEIDWFALITDVARNALKAADAVMPPSGAIFDDVSRKALVEIRNIAYNMMQGTQAQLSIPDEFRRIHERAEALLQLLDKARAS